MRHEVLISSGLIIKIKTKYDAPLHVMHVARSEVRPAPEKKTKP